LSCSPSGRGQKSAETTNIAGPKCKERGSTLSANRMQAKRRRLKTTPEKKELTKRTSREHPRNVALEGDRPRGKETHLAKG